ncbi:hypothetical protein JCM31185_16230 [Furfurilactobacillus curtus]|uniref:Transposase n=1 Tax=Furfurilactobacillus curtus TaxID=1746200 RepID=A0ABQ5JP42_9LACO
MENRLISLSTFGETVSSLINGMLHCLSELNRIKSNIRYAFGKVYPIASRAL